MQTLYRPYERKLDEVIKAQRTENRQQALAAPQESIPAPSTSSHRSLERQISDISAHRLHCRSPAEMADDRQSQAEEVEALAAIFDTHFALSAEAPNIAGTLSVPLELPDELRVVVRAWPPKPGSPPGPAATLRWLPPIVVRFFMPENYPSQECVSVVIDCRWLLPGQRRRLELQLKQLWEDSGHEVVLFEFTRFLQDDLLDSFKLLSSDGQLTIWVDEREQSTQMVWDALNAHEAKMVSEQFDRSTFDCGVCFEEKKGSSCVRFGPCGHVFCKDCTRNFFEVLIKDNLTEALRCPDTTCGKSPNTEPGRLDSATLESLLGAELYARYTTLAEKNSLEKRRDVAWCPRPFCQSLALKDKDIEKMAVCSACSFAFCYVCQRSWHGSRSCAIKNLQATIERYIAARDRGDKKMLAELEFKYGAKLLARLVTDYENEAETLRWKKENAQACPTCGTDIERTEGCNHMLCSKCG